MAELVPGQRVSLESSIVQLRIDGPRLDALVRELGAIMVALDTARHVPAAFPPLDIAAREMRPGANYGPNGDLRLDLSSLPTAVDRILLVLHIIRGPGKGISFRDFGSITLSVERHRFELDLASRGDAALIMVEIYRRGDSWRLSASGQGFTGGLPALGNALGMNIPVPVRVESSRDSADPDLDTRPPSALTFSGSGFAVDEHHVLTNAHVIEGARRVEVAGDRLSGAAEVVFSDPRNDIALLRVERQLAAAARFRDLFDIHLGEDVVVLGFPLQGLLGAGPQATGGNVSALCGIGNDTSVLQFSAPIASGNSGGPILDQSGLVVGLVHASLNMDRIREGGSRAENINFGVKGAVVRAFLGTVGIDPQLASGGPQRGRADIVREARSYIYRIRCEG